MYNKPLNYQMFKKKQESINKSKNKNAVWSLYQLAIKKKNLKSRDSIDFKIINDQREITLEIYDQKIFLLNTTFNNIILMSEK